MADDNIKELLATSLKLGEKNLDALLTLRVACRRAVELLDSGRVREARDLIRQALLEKRK